MFVRFLVLFFGVLGFVCGQGTSSGKDSLIPVFLERDFLRMKLMSR